MTLNVSEQAQPQASKALSGTQKAPLFRWNGIQDDEDAPLQEAFYAKCLDGIAIFGRCACKFSPPCALMVRTLPLQRCQRDSLSEKNR